MRIVHSVIFVLFPIFMLAQMHDYTWVMGYEGGSISPNQDTFGLSIMDFTNEQLTVYDNQYGEAEFRHNNVSFSSQQGELSLYYTGTGIYGSDHNLIENGDNWFEGNLSGGWRQPQSGVMLDFYDKTDTIFFINVENNLISSPSITDVFGEKLFYSEIVKSSENGFCKVNLRKQLLLEDTLTAGKLSASKHANGRDWWIIVPKWNSNEYYRYLLTPFGLDSIGIQIVGGEVKNGLGQSVFSSDGTKYVRYDGISSTIGDYVTVYDFDRCTGILSNFRQAQYEKEGSGGGASISKNSRYLYIMAGLNLFQYDLLAEDIMASRSVVAEWDGFVDPFPTTFHQGQLAPDGKIYIASSNGVTSMHVIHNPDEICPGCNIEQHGIELPTYNAYSIPNQPNYRLGPIDGSPCDTLGIDNIPLCRWRYTQDTLSPLQVHFTDLSDYEPADWLWDFGDNTTSTEVNPTHTFSEEGTYTVCLTVSNENGSDTQCKELTFEIISTVAEEVLAVPVATLFPNPFRRYLTLSLRPDWLPTDARVLVYDQLGKQVLQRRLAAGINTLDFGKAAAGVYFYQIIAEGRLVQSGTVVKQ